MATLLIDLLSLYEDSVYENRFDIDLLTTRLVAVTEFVRRNKNLKHLHIGYFGASTGAASALEAAARLGETVEAIVSRGGRPDLAETGLPLVKAPTLLIVGGLDVEVIEMNRDAYGQLNCEKRMVIVEGATHLFEEEGKLEEVAKLATEWFESHLVAGKANKSINKIQGL
jgi:dienelactone hydrolase